MTTHKLNNIEEILASKPASSVKFTETEKATIEQELEDCSQRRSVSSSAGDLTLAAVPVVPYLNQFFLCLKCLD